MMEFSVGDRVQVQAMPLTAPYAGRKGEVVWFSRTPAGVVFGYHVRLDGNLLGVDEVCAIFGPNELEPEPEGDPR